MDYKKVVEKLANDILEQYAEFGEEITDKMVSDFVEDKRDYLENYDEYDYERDVMDKIQEIGQLEIEQNTKKPKIDNEQTETGQETDEKETETQTQTDEIDEENMEMEEIEAPKTPTLDTGKTGKLWDFGCNASMLKTLCKKALAINNEVPLYIRKDGIQIKTVDPSHVSMVDIKIPRKDFYTGNTCINKEIHYNLQEDLDIGIDLNKLERTLKLFDNSDRVNGYIENNKLNLISEYNDKILHKRISLLDTAGMTEAKIPNMEFDIKAEVKSSEFATLKKALEDEDYVVFIAKEDLRAIIKNDEDDLTMTLSKKDDVKGTGKALYSSDYLKNIIDVFGGGFYYNIDVAFSTDNPIKFEGKIADTGTYTYLLAPRIESDNL